MSTILDTIAEYTKTRIEISKKDVSLTEIRKLAEQIKKQEKENADREFIFEKQLKKDDISFICECKKASPSKGIIAEKFDYLEIAGEYEKAGASAISVLTEPKWFLGSNDYLKEIAKAVKIPCLRKDFTVDEYMIYEAKTLGASAVLLICAITENERLKEYIQVCDSLGLSALVETHDEKEIESALTANARVIGVNNRNLKDFTVDIHTSERLKKLVPDDICFVAESGIKTAADIQRLREAKVNAVLIGETFMLAENKKQMLDTLKGKSL